MDTEQSKASENRNNRYLSKIEKLNLELENYYSHELKIEHKFSRKLVSYQGNKNSTFFRWYKYKEAFSTELVDYLSKEYCKIGSDKQTSRIILDPFAGAGTTLFSCSKLGFKAQGIELLPVGHNIIETYRLAKSIKDKSIIDKLKYWQKNKLWNKKGKLKDFEVLPITEQAYPQETEYKIKRYLSEISSEKADVKKILLFALLCILESISYTRKDGQYLRWDRRSGRSRGNFYKGKILSFDEAITNKLNQIIQDLSINDIKPDIFKNIDTKEDESAVNLLKGSCLDILSNLQSEIYEGIITSPPYCNRYDYTRTYALEHALLDVDHQKLSSFRQAMLSCTVESREKDLLAINSDWSKAIGICDRLPLLQEIINYLNYKNEQGELNNKGIARMVKNYFYEMACVIQECYRVLKKGRFMCMANDNVRYAGASISVDLILSKIAEDIGFEIENIFVLPLAKGNSSQQMDRHGKKSLRKCIYIWKKKKMFYTQHIKSYESLITPRHKIRSGFIELALEKNKQATPFIEEAKALRVIAKQASNPKELLNIESIKSSLLTASGISNKANQYFGEEDKQEAILGLIENFLEPSGKDFVDELVNRFLLTRGDSLGGIMRNLGGRLGEWKLTRILISTLSIYGQELKYLDRDSNHWIQTNNKPELEKDVKGLYWKLQNKERTLMYNQKVPIVRKNVDLNLFDCTPNEIKLAKKNPEKYIALGELKGGVDPAGADEHWKTANSALQRIRKSFSLESCHPHTFFVGAAIEKSMAQEIYQQLENNVLSNGANLTDENQMVALCSWLINL